MKKEKEKFFLGRRIPALKYPTVTQERLWASNIVSVFVTVGVLTALVRTCTVTFSTMISCYWPRLGLCVTACVCLNLVRITFGDESFGKESHA